MAELAEKKSGGLAQVRETISAMTMGRRLMFLGLGALVIGTMVALLLYINQPEYQVLYSNLEQQDASMVVNQLKELKVPYKLEGNGTLIKVPLEQVYETRLAMAGAGLPRGGKIGFEVFNEVKMGTTEFVQKINYQRALQGELARTIASFSEVSEARVHIVMPRDSLFVEDQKRPSAAVVVRLRAGRSLAKGQVASIVHLVSGSVPDLTDSDVTVVDTDGNLLYRKEADRPGFAAALTASQLEYQQSVEAGIRNKVQSMLEQFLGMGRAVVRVSADIDFTNTSTVQESFDPDQVVVRSESRSTESDKGAAGGQSGTPDNRYSLATRNATPSAGATQGGSESNRENETTNFEIGRTRTQKNQAIAGLQRLSVAVVVDGPYKATTDADGNTTRAFAPRTAEEMRQIQELVRRAAGYNDKRGDEVTVANVPFVLPAGLGTAATKGWQDYLQEYSKPLLNLVLALLFILLVLRPLMKHFLFKGAPMGAGVGGAERRVGPSEELPPGETPMEGEREMLEALSGKRKMTTRDIILALSQQDPEKTTALLRSLIHEA